MVRTIILSILTVFTFSNKLTALPGGYIGLSFLFDFKSKEKGLQFSTGLALPFIGEPSLGPYAFPGVTVGLRHTNNKGFYSYIDIQIVASNAVWAGAGLGLAFKEGNQYIRKKYFMGLFFDMLGPYWFATYQHYLDNFTLFGPKGCCMGHLFQMHLF